MLSSVYFKPPEAFVKKIRDRINERLDLDNEEEAPVSLEAVMSTQDSAGVKRSEYAKDAEAPTDY